MQRAPLSSIFFVWCELFHFPCSISCSQFAALSERFFTWRIRSMNLLRLTLRPKSPHHVMWNILPCFRSKFDLLHALLFQGGQFVKQLKCFVFLWSGALNIWLNCASLVIISSNFSSSGLILPIHLLPISRPLPIFEWVHLFQRSVSVHQHGDW